MGRTLLTCGNDFLFCGNNLLICGNDLLTCGNDLLTCGNEIKNARKTVLCPFQGSVGYYVDLSHILAETVWVKPYQTHIATFDRTISHKSTS